MTIRTFRSPAIGVALLVAGCAAAVQTPREAGRDFERTVAASPGGELTLNLDSGGGVIVHGSSENRVTVRARLGGRDWRDTEVTIERVPGGVRLGSRLPPRTNSTTAHAFEIRVPRRYNLRLESTGGGVTLRDLEGTFRGHTAGGAIDIERVSGRVALTTGGGTVRVRDSDLDGFVTTGGGVVTVVNTRGDLRTASGSQPADVASFREAVDPPRRDRGVIRIRKAGGAIHLAEASDGADVYTGGGSIHIGRASGFVRAETGGGAIQLGPITGSVVARTGNGSVHVSLDRLEGATLDIKSGLGDVVLDLPSDLSADIDLETAYTDVLGRATAINSQWPLERAETNEWDSTRGTPRRYVRSRGRIGNGGPVVRVRTVNGDIILRRRPQSVDVRVGSRALERR
jgi:hypothetical protein